MKFKPIHWILIAVLLIEAVVLGVWFGSRHNDSATPSNPTELLLSYDANEDGSFTILSLLSNAEAPTIAFTYEDKEYTYDVSLVEIVDAYRTFDNYKKLESDASEGLWNAFKETVSAETNKHTNKQHASIEYIRNVAQSGYNVPHEQLYDNVGMYTINTTTTINNWKSVFADYLIKDNNGNVPNELAMGATVRIGDVDYNAIVYTLIYSDGDNKNDSTAQEVSVHILFGDHIISDITLSDATIYYLKPDGSAYFAHSDIKVTYLAANNEARYRDLLNLGGLQ